MKKIWKLIISILFISMLSAQESELYTPVNIQNAFTNKTRSIDGLPGTEYWQNRADYKIDVEINPQNGLVIGSEEIIYFNNSPDSLRSLVHMEGRPSPRRTATGYFPLQVSGRRQVPRARWPLPAESGT